MKTRICGKCGIRKKVTAFLRRERGVLRNECKECHNQYQRSRYLERLGKFKRTVRAEKRETNPKKCIRCEEIKALDQFGWHNRTKGQHRNICKDCFNAWTREYNKRSESKKVRNDWNEKNADRIETYKDGYRNDLCNDPEKRKASKEYHRNHRLLKEFGITPEDYDKMFEDQNGKCAICGTEKLGSPGKHLAVDHDHATGKIRGLLCSRCNRTIGWFDDNPSLLRKAAQYLEQ